MPSIRADTATQSSNESDSCSVLELEYRHATHDLIHRTTTILVTVTVLSPDAPITCSVAVPA